MKITFQYKLKLLSAHLILYIHTYNYGKSKNLEEIKHDLILRIEDLNKEQLATSHIVAITRERFVCY